VILVGRTQVAYEYLALDVPEAQGGDDARHGHILHRCGRYVKISA
jgi:hypothetical protein